MLYIIYLISYIVYLFIFINIHLLYFLCSTSIRHAGISAIEKQYYYYNT